MPRDHVVAAASVLHPVADDLLGATTSAFISDGVVVGRVEECDPALERGVQNPERLFLVALVPKGHRAETQARYAQTGPTKGDVFHAGESVRVGGLEPEVCAGLARSKLLAIALPH